MESLANENAVFAMKTGLPEEVVQFFAANPLPAMWSLPDVLRDPNHQNFYKVNAALDAIDSDAVDTFQGGDQFFFYENRFPGDPDRGARVGVLVNALDEEVLRRRNEILTRVNQTEPPPPYQHPALNGITINENYLVRLTDFDTSRRFLSRNGWAFHVVPTLPSLNSSYWFMNELYEPSLAELARIRLDPFMIQSAQGYAPMEYKMRVYGVALDWTQIAALREPLHLQFMQDPQSLGRSDIALTDVVWSQREDGVHFICEELPTVEARESRSSRYFHSIYDPHDECFVHADGALRFYRVDELAKRNLTHVRNAGKAGTRVKVFQLDGAINRDAWCSVVSSFFVWNEDVMGYFGAGVA
jgi:hypothetical protein